MSEQHLVVTGYLVKRVDEANPDGKIISRVYHAKEAAENFAALARKYGNGRGQVFVTEKLGVE
jgi:hypothetical protein